MSASPQTSLNVTPSSIGNRYCSASFASLSKPSFRRTPIAFGITHECGDNGYCSLNTMLLGVKTNAHRSAAVRARQKTLSQRDVGVSGVQIVLARLYVFGLV